MTLKAFLFLTHSGPNGHRWGMAGLSVRADGTRIVVPNPYGD